MFYYIRQKAEIKIGIMRRNGRIERVATKLKLTHVLDRGERGFEGDFRIIKYSVPRI